MFERSVSRRLFLFLLLVLVGGLASLGAGGRKEQETEVQLRRPPAYISPGNPETGKDSLTIDNIQVNIDPKGAIKRYELRIYNKSGEVIFSKAEENLSGRGFIAEVFNVGEIPSVAVPETINWPGVDSSGKAVDDGEYFYQLTVLDSFGKRSSTPPLSVVVDRVDPRIFATSSDRRIVSPDGDGKRDTISFSARTDSAARWVQEIVNSAGEVVWTATLEAPGDTSLTDVTFAEAQTWDGKANQGSGNGETVPEGAYKWRLTGADRANNQASEEVTFTVSFSTGGTELAIRDDKAAWSGREPLVFLPTLSETRGLVSWTLEVMDSQDVVQRRYEGTSSLPASVSFDLTGNPGRPLTAGQALADGTYRGILRALYDSGVEAESDFVSIRVDRTAPEGGLTIDSSPVATERGRTLYVGTTTRPGLSIFFWSSRAADETWTLVVTDRSGVEVASAPVADFLGSPRDVNGRMEYRRVWDLTLADGTPLADGTYGVQAKGLDEAGNPGLTSLGRFVVDRQELGGTRLDLDGLVLAPGGDAGRDRLVVGVFAESLSPVDSALFSVFASGSGLPGERGSASGGAVMTQLFRDLPDSWVWTGLRDNGMPAPDGTYLVRLAVRWENGEETTVESPVFLLGRSRPRISVEPKTLQFSPNGDGLEDTFSVTQSGSAEELWTGRMVDAAGKTVRTWEWEGAPTTLDWDGRDDQGNLLPDGTYRYQVEAVNALGNRGSAAIEGIRIDMLGGTLGLALGEPVLSPNGDGRFDTLEAQVSFTLGDQVERWELVYEGTDVAAKKTFAGQGGASATLVWDGNDDQGRVATGRYRPRLTAWLKDGRETSLTHPKDVTVYLTGPALVLSPVEPTFSPDGDGQNDRAVFALSASPAPFPLESWTLTVVDPSSGTFRSLASGTVLPPTVQWDGKGDDGSTALSGVEYAAVMVGRDAYGAESRVMATVTTDIMLKAIAQGYQIDLPGIIFPGNSYNLFAGSLEQSDKNADTLRRLADLIKRYPDFTIQIRGHATYVLGTDPATRDREQRLELVPLSRERAREVMEALFVLGIPWERMAIEGLGGLEPLAPHEDATQRWKNRRVEFIFIRMTKE